MNPVLIDRWEIDDEEWDSFINQSSQNIVYALSWYLDTVCESWKALICSSLDGYRIVMPIPIRKKWGIKIVQQPLFCQYLGLFSKEEITSEEAVQFLQAFSVYFNFISSYDFHPLNFDAISAAASRFTTLNFEVRNTYWLSLDIEYDLIEKSYSKDRRKNIKIATKWNWELRESMDVNPLINLFISNHQKQISGGVAFDTYALLTRLVTVLQQKSNTEIWYAYQDAKIHAGVLIAKHQGKAIYLFNAADEIGRVGNARTYIIDQYFKTYSGSNLIFDFESPDIESIASFYKSFGGTKMPYLRIRQNNLPFPLKQIQSLRERIYLKPGKLLF